MKTQLSSKSQKLLTLFTQPRIKILLALYHCYQDPCGYDLTQKLKMKKNLLSYHLKFLLFQNAVSQKRCGRFKKYYLDPSQKEKTKKILKTLELI